MTYMIRCIPPANNSLGINPCPVPGGRQYSCAVGSTIDVPDHDAMALAANGWQLSQGPKGICGGVGTTAQRPSNTSNPPAIKNMTYVDTTLGACIIFTGVNWVNEVTGAVV
jgi:hypothetical protein